MHYILSLLLLAELILFAQPLQANTPTPDSFAYGVKLSVSSQEPLYGSDLPPSVYRHIGKSDLSDLRIFNAQDSVVPHFIRPAKHTSKDQILQLPLPIFPMFGKSEQQLPNNISVMVKRDPFGSIVDVKLADQEEESTTPSTLFYLLDCTNIKKSLHGLDIYWEGVETDFFTKIKVESSEDLISWQIHPTATIAALHHLGRSFFNRRIKLPNKRYRYLRLTPVKSGEQVTIHKVIGLQSHTVTSHPTERESFAITPSRQNSNSTQFLFDLGGFFPTDQIQILLQQPNSMAEARLLTGPDPKEENMKEVWRGLLYFLVRDGSEMRNDTILLPTNKHRYWSLVFKNNESDPGVPPQLRFSYLPDQIIFLGSGKGPFMLAYGNPTIPAPTFAMDSLLTKYRDNSGRKIKVKQITTGKEIILGGTERLRMPRPSLPWKKYILWLVLFAGTGMVVKMSLSLYRQLNTDTKQNENKD